MKILSQSHVFPTETLDLLRVLCLYFFGGLIRRSFWSHPGVILQLLGDFQLNKWSFNGRLLWDIVAYCLANYILVFFECFFCTIYVSEDGGSNTRNPKPQIQELSSQLVLQYRSLPTERVMAPTAEFSQVSEYDSVMCCTDSKTLHWDLCPTFSRFSDASTTRTRSISGGAAPSGGYGPWTPYPGAFCIFGQEITFGERRDLSKSSECHLIILIIFDIHVEILAFCIFNPEPIHRIWAEFGQVLMWNCIHPSACVQAQLRP